MDHNERPKEVLVSGKGSLESVESKISRVVASKELEIDQQRNEND